MVSTIFIHKNSLHIHIDTMSQDYSKLTLRRPHSELSPLCVVPDVAATKRIGRVIPHFFDAIICDVGADDTLLSFPIFTQFGVGKDKTQQAMVQTRL